MKACVGSFGWRRERECSCYTRARTPC